MRVTQLIFLFSATSLIVTGFNFQRPVFPKTISLPKCTLPILASLVSVLVTPDISAAAAAAELKQYSNPRYHTGLFLSVDLIFFDIIEVHPILTLWYTRNVTTKLVTIISMHY
jgi:hypothetical protein